MAKESESINRPAPQALIQPELIKNGRQLATVTEPTGSDDDELDLRQILTVLKRRGWLIGRVSAIAAVVMSAWVLTQPPEYQGGFSLLIEPVTKGSRIANSLTSETSQSQGMGDDNYDTYDPKYVSQIAVLQSEALMEPIVQRIQSRYPDLDYDAIVGSMSIETPEDSKILEISYSSGDPEEIRFVLIQLADGYLRYSIEDRQKNIRQGIEFVDKQLDRQRQTVAKLERELERLQQRNNLVEPRETSASLSDQLSNLLSQQRDNSVKLAAAQSEYVGLQQQIGLAPNIALLATNLSESPTYQELWGKIQDIDREIAKESARFRMNTPVVQPLIDQRAKLWALLQVEATRVAGIRQAGSVANATTLGYQGSVSRDLVQQYVNTTNQVRSLQAQDQALSTNIAQLNSQVRALATISRQYGQIQRNLEIASESLGRLLAGRENLQLELARQLAGWELMTKINSDSISDVSGTSRQLTLVWLMSLLLGIGAAFLAETLDRVFHSPDEFKEYGLPTLGLIPFNRQIAQARIVQDLSSIQMPEGATQKQKRRSRRYAAPFLESFYSLDANIRLLGSDSAIRSIVTTSANPGDGKSTTSTHLALAAAKMGRRVLLVDVDLRRPQIHNIFDIPNLRGLSDILTSDMEPSQAIQVSPQESNLHLLTSGVLPPAPGRLISSGKMRNLADRFIQQYDLIIYDCPPSFGFADAKLMSAYTDGILLVVGLGKTDRRAFSQALTDLQTAQVPVLGFVVNGMKQQPKEYSYYHYYQKYYQEDEK